MNGRPLAKRMIKAILPRDAVSSTNDDVDSATLQNSSGRSAVERVVEQPKRLSADLRLVIDFDEDRNIYIYKSVDRVTGEVVSQLPQEDVRHLASSTFYSPGGLVNRRS